jgi:hypothetical protein
MGWNKTRQDQQDEACYEKKSCLHGLICLLARRSHNHILLLLRIGCEGRKQGEADDAAPYRVGHAF